MYTCHIKNVLVVSTKPAHHPLICQVRTYPMLLVNSFDSMMRYLEQQHDADGVMIEIGLLKGLSSSVAERMIHRIVPAAVVIFIIPNRKMMAKLHAHVKFIVEEPA